MGNIMPPSPHRDDSSSYRSKGNETETNNEKEKGK
jgi:hypothetical protein